MRSERDISWRATKKNISGKCIWSFYDGAQNMDEYFFTEIKPFLSSTAELRIARCDLRNNRSRKIIIPYAFAWMKVVTSRLRYILSREFLHRFERRSTPLLFLGFSIGPIVSFPETRVVIPADVTH